MRKEFEINASADCLRLLNWDVFISKKKIIREQSARTISIFVTYNLSGDAINTIDALTRCLDLDVLVIDNCSNELHYSNLYEKCKECPNVSLISLIENLGGAGGYAVGLEYILNKDYDFVLITEDDAQLKNKDDVINILRYASNKKTTSIWFENNNSSSFNFHWMLYPIELIKAAGVPDPRYFMRSDDFEFGMRIQLGKKNLKMGSLIVDSIKYTHPIVKENKTVWMEYFSTRNSLETYVRHKLFKNFISEPIKKVPYAFFKLFQNSDSSSIRIFTIAIVDFLLVKMCLNINRERIGGLSKIKSFYPENELSITTIDKFNHHFSNSNNVLLGSSLSNFFPNLSDSKSLISIIFRRKSCIIAGYFTPLLPVAYLFKEITVIGSISSNGESISYFRLTGLSFKNFFNVFASAISSILVLALLLPCMMFAYFIRTKM